jgi:hypothetical protein
VAQCAQTAPGTSLTYKYSTDDASRSNFTGVMPSSCRSELEVCRGDRVSALLDERWPSRDQAQIPVCETTCAETCSGACRATSKCSGPRTYPRLSTSSVVSDCNTYVRTSHIYIHLTTSVGGHGCYTEPAAHAPGQLSIQRRVRCCRASIAYRICNYRA